MKTIRFSISLFSLLLLHLPAAGLAQDFPQSGFLDDYSQLRPVLETDELVKVLTVDSARLRCRFDNAGGPEKDRRNCFEITEADVQDRL